jgi:hypothetical protein
MQWIGSSSPDRSPNIPENSRPVLRCAGTEAIIKPFETTTGQDGAMDASKAQASIHAPLGEPALGSCAFAPASFSKYHNSMVRYPVTALSFSGAACLRSTCMHSIDRGKMMRPRLPALHGEETGNPCTQAMCLTPSPRTGGPSLPQSPPTSPLQHDSSPHSLRTERGVHGQPWPPTPQQAPWRSRHQHLH